MKKFIGFLMVCSVFLFQTSVAQAAFRDVPEDHTNFSAISNLEEEGFLDKDPLFFPDRKITRPEFLKMAFDAAAYTDLSVLESVDFQDIVASDWFSPYVQKAVELRAFFIGPEFRFYPSRFVNKIEGLRAVFKIFETGIPRFVPSDFSLPDVSSGAWFAPVVFRAHELGVAIPRDKNFFGSFDRLSRGEAAEIIYRVRLTQLARANSFSELVPQQNLQINIEQAESVRYSLLDTIWEVLEDSYFDSSKLNENKMIYGAASGFVKSLGDPHTSFFSPEETNSFSSTLGNNLVGIGAYIAEEDGKIIIISPIAKSPAERAGLRSEDVILKVNGTPTAGMTLTETVMKIRGRAGTTVKLTISRNSNEVFEVNIIREKINIKSVEWEIKNKNIAYIMVNQFVSTTSNEFSGAVKNILLKNPDGLILDLRNNPGGFLDTAIDLTSYFLRKGDLVARTRDRYGNATNYVSEVDGELRHLKTVVLVNKGSASASEIMAGTLQDYGVAVVIGQQTYGKGTAQLIQNFSDGSSMKFTVAKWFTPNDRNIDKQGITPDVSVVQSDDKSIDAELNRALNYF